jgi:uncharacterized protein (DUF2249 family)
MTAMAKIRAHHTELVTALRDRAEAFFRAVRQRDAWTEAERAFEQYVREEVLPHAEAEERHLYARAHLEASTALLVDGLLKEHRLLRRLADAAASHPDPLEAATQARVLAVVFAAHAEKEDDLLLPRLAASGVDLDEALAAMHEALEAPSDPTLPEVDVRSLPPPERHRLLLGLAGRLRPGEGFVLVNDHDPGPFRRALEATAPGRFTWTVLEAGPEAWRLRLVRRVEDR